MQNIIAIIIIFADILMANTYIMPYVPPRISQPAMTKEITLHISFRFDLIMRIIKIRFIFEIVQM